MFKKSFFTKLLIAYFTIVIAYTAIAVCLFFYKDNQNVRHELNQKNQSFLEQAREKIDSKYAVAFNLINQLKLNEHIINFASGDSDYYSITRTYYELRNHLDAFAEFGYKIDLMENDGELVITPHYSIDKERYFEEIGLSEELFQDKLSLLNGKRLNTLATLPSSPSHTENTEDDSVYGYDRVITTVSPEKMRRGNTLFFIVSIYEQQLLPLLASESHEAFAIIEDDQYVAFKSTFDSKQTAELLRLPLDQLEKPVSADYEKYKSGPYEIHMIRSLTMPAWTYMYLTPVQSFDETFNMNGTLLLFGILTAAGLIVSYIVTRRMYKPVNRLVDLFKGYDHTPNKDEFTFLHETAVKINTANEQLKSAMNENRLPLREKFMRDLLHGLVPQEQIQAQLGAHQLEQLQSDLTVCVIAFSKLKELMEQYSKEAILTIKSQTSLIMQEELKESFVCELLDLDFSKYVLIVQHTNTEDIQRKLTQTMSHITEGYTFGMIAAVGQPVSSVADIEQSFSQAMQVLEWRSAVDRTTIMTYKQLSQMQMDNYYYPIDAERDIISLVIRGEREQASTILNRILQENLEKRTLIPEQLEQFGLLLLATLNRIMQQLNKAPSEFWQQHNDPLETLRNSESSAEAISAIVHLFDTMIDMISQQSEMMDQSTVKQMMEYIHENYHIDLSLTMIAETFNFSPGYVSVAFKKYAGENFKDYLNIYRVQKAKEIMQKEKVKIGDLALMVGCNNANTFIRMFRKYEGISPGQYAKNVQ
ncbi:helix-turn-helix domain-containing protein [Paenibacillus sp. IITD108]|uniref:helix-turn-helix domain-containing protein n=1 Tax=Paenibacillus sp. IITD108 TaxID=3116649 RepID=UPI002F41E067